MAFSLNKADIMIISSNSNLFSPWYDLQKCSLDIITTYTHSQSCSSGPESVCVCVGEGRGKLLEVDRKGMEVSNLQIWQQKSQLASKYALISFDTLTISFASLLKIQLFQNSCQKEWGQKHNFAFPTFQSVGTCALPCPRLLRPWLRHLLIAELNFRHTCILMNICNCNVRIINSKCILPNRHTTPPTSWRYIK